MKEELCVILGVTNTSNERRVVCYLGEQKYTDNKKVSPVKLHKINPTLYYTCTLILFAVMNKQINDLTRAER